MRFIPFYFPKSDGTRQVEDRYPFPTEGDPKSNVPRRVEAFTAVVCSADRKAAMVKFASNYDALREVFAAQSDKPQCRRSVENAITEVSLLHRRLGGVRGLPVLITERSIIHGALEPEALANR